VFTPTQNLSLKIFRHAQMFWLTELFYNRRWNTAQTCTWNQSWLKQKEFANEDRKWEAKNGFANRINLCSFVSVLEAQKFWIVGSLGFESHCYGFRLSQNPFCTTAIINKIYWPTVQINKISEIKAWVRSINLIEFNRFLARSCSTKMSRSVKFYMLKFTSVLFSIL
jgi:hypothetical protein